MSTFLLVLQMYNWIDNMRKFQKPIHYILQCSVWKISQTCTICRMLHFEVPHFIYLGSYFKSHEKCDWLGCGNFNFNALQIYLSLGPTAHFKLSNVKITKDIRRDWREITNHRPEVILNNFTTRLGHSVARMLAVLFHYDPQFRGKRAVTFHNQRDYIFFRHHR